MNAYGRWSGAQRLASLKLTKQAITDGLIPAPSKCNRCGQTEGTIHYHNHNYDDPVEFLEQMCWRCHMVFHSAHFAPEQVKAYFAAVAAGKCWPATQSFKALEIEHGIIKKPYK